MTTPRHGTSPLATLPGLLLVAVLVAIAVLVAELLPWMSTLTVAVVLGIALGNTGALPERALPGVRLCGRLLLRLGIALLGLQLVMADVMALGLWPVLGVCVALLLVFATTVWGGQRLGLPTGRAVLVASGVAVCGAAAIAAMSSVTESDEEDAATAVAVVTLYGTAAIFLLPLAVALLSLGERAAGAWAGASVHEVAQVVATAASFGEEGLLIAVVVKLVRVLMLAPLVVVGGVMSRRSATAGGAKVGMLLPWFLVAFVVAVAIRATDAVPDGALDAAELASRLLLAAALVSLGTGVRLRRLVTSGGRAMLLGLLATALAVTLGLLVALLV